MQIGQALKLRHEDVRSWDNEIEIVYRADNANGALAKEGALYCSRFKGIDGALQ
jgi:hypothetical protein